LISSFYKALAGRIAALAVGLVCGCLSLKLYGRYLPKEVYGVVVVALQVVGYLPFLDGGFRTTTNREILAERDAEKRYRLINFAQTFYSLFAVIIFPAALALMIGYSFTPTVSGSGEPRWFFAALALTGTISIVGWAQIGLLVGLEAQTSFYAMNAVSGLVGLGTLWLSLRNGLGIWAFPISTCAGLLICYPLALWLIRRKEPRIRFFQWKAGADFWSQFKHLGRDAWPCFRVEVGAAFLYTVDLVLVALICGSKSAAIYGVVSRLIAMTRSFLQATGEVAWPLVAQKSGSSHALGTFLLRFNGWLIGSVVGAMALTLGPFLGYYMGPSWTPPRLLTLLLTGRLLVTGTCSAAPYLLMGLGQFALVARYMQRELLGAVVLGVSLGLIFGMTGIALGFLISTGFGTFASYFYAYGRAVNIPGGSLMWQAWWRAIIAYGVGITVSALLLPWSHSAWQTFGVGAVAATAAVTTGLVVCGVRLSRSPGSSAMAFKLGDLAAKI